MMNHLSQFFTLLKVSVTLIIISFICALKANSQTLDYRNCQITKQNETVKTRIAYPLNFLQQQSLRIKDNSQKSVIDLKEVQSLQLNNREYVVFRDPRNGSYELGTVHIDGAIALLESKNDYFLKFNDSIFALEVKKEQKKVGSQVKTVTSLTYLATLQSLFPECKIPYERITRLNTKHLIAVVSNIAECKNLQIKEPRRPSAFEMGVIGTFGKTNFRTAYFLDGLHSDDVEFGSIGLTFLHDLIGIDKLKLRGDMQIRRHSHSGSRELINSYSTKDLSGRPRKELVYYAFSQTNIEIPVGLQYYIFKRTIGLYLNFGTTFYAAGPSTMKVDGYEKLSDNLLIPRYKYDLRVETNAIGWAYWAGGGFEFDISERSSIFIEGRINKNASTKTNLTTIINGSDNQSTDRLNITDLTASTGLKFTL